jgi:hypothetical protein
MSYIIPDRVQQPDGQDDEGFINSVVEGLRSIPHLPAALINGVNDPKANPRELALRKRALAEASQWVIPLMSSGAAALIPATGGASVLIGAVADAVGMGVGSGLAEHYRGNDENVAPAAVSGALLGGVFGAGLGGLKLGAEKFAAGEATRLAGEAMEKETATNLAKHKFGAQGDLFDFGMTGQERQTLAGAMPQDLRNIRTPLPPEPQQLNLFGNTPENPSSINIPDSGIASAMKSVAAARGKVPVTFGARQAAGIEEVKGVSALHAAGESPSQLVAKVNAGIDLNPKVPRTFKNKVPPTPKALLEELRAQEPTDGVLAMNGITPTVAEAASGVERKAVIGARDVFAADQQIKSAFGDFGDKILKGDLHGVGKALAKGAQAVRLSDTWKEAGSVLSRSIEPARKTLQRMGPAGVELAAMLDKVFVNWREGAGEHMAQIQKILEPWAGRAGKADRIHIGEIMEGLATPKSDAHAAAAEQLKGVLSWYADSAEQLGIKQIMENDEVREFTRIGTYLPHYIDFKNARKYMTPGTQEFEAAHAMLMKMGQTNSRAQTSTMLRAHFSTPPEFRTGPLNFVRGHFNLPYEKDPLLATSRYVYSVRKRIEAAKLFGSDYKGVLPYYERINLDGGDSKVAQRIFSAFNDALPQSYTKLVKAISTYNVWTMLSTSGIVQPAQLLNTAAMTSYGSTLKAIGAALRAPKTADYMATKAGVHINEVLQDLMGVSMGNDPTAGFLKYVIGLEPMDKANRVVSALAGRFELDRLAERMAVTSGKPIGRLGDAIKRLGIDPAELVANEFKPTEKMYRDAAYNVSVSTQHASGILDQPEFKNSAMGHVLYQFRSFSLQQAGFINKDVLGPMNQYLRTGGQRGSLAPLARYSAGLGPTGAVIGELVRGIKGHPEPSDPTRKMVENIALAGGLGIYYDMLDAMVSGKDRFLSFLAGPGVSEVAAYAADLTAVPRNPEQLAKHLVKRVPVVGQTLANYWFWPQGTK